MHANPLSTFPAPPLSPLGSPRGSDDATEVPPVATFVVGAHGRRFQLPVTAARRSPVLAQLLDGSVGVDLSPDDDAVQLSINPALFEGVAQFLREGRVRCDDVQHFYGIREVARYLVLDGVSEEVVCPIGVRMELKARRLVEEQCDRFVADVFTPWIEHEVDTGETQFQFFVMPDCSHCDIQYPNVLEDPLIFRILLDPARRGIWAARMEEVTGMRLDVCRPNDDHDGKSVLLSTQVQPAGAPHVGDVTTDSGEPQGEPALGRFERRVKQLASERCDFFLRSAFLPWVEAEVEQGKTSFVFHVMAGSCRETYPNVLEDEVVWNILDDPVRRSTWVSRMEEVTGMRVHIGDPFRDDDSSSIEISTSVETHRRRGEPADGFVLRLVQRSQELLLEKCDEFCKGTFMPWVRQEVEQGVVAFQYDITEPADRIVWNILQDGSRREAWVQRMELNTGLAVEMRDRASERSVRVSASIPTVAASDTQLEDARACGSVSDSSSTDCARRDRSDRSSSSEHHTADGPRDQELAAPASIGWLRWLLPGLDAGPADLIAEIVRPLSTAH